MMRDNYREICEGKDLRANVAALKKELTDEYSIRDFGKITGGDYQVIVKLLENEDPKVRKNAGAILGSCMAEGALRPLWNAYQKERTLFVRPAYLKAMSAFDCSMLKDQLKKREEKLMMTEPAEEERKHRAEELAALRAILSRYEEHRKHSFRMPEKTPDVILITNRAQREVTGRQISQGSLRWLGAGLKVSGGSLEELLKIRTVEEYLFPLPGCAGVGGSPEEIAGQLVKAGLTSFLEEMHTPAGVPYFYRLDIRGKVPQEKKGALIRRISDALERSTKGALRNSSSDYEAELRLLEKKDGTFVPCLKLYTLPDDRFAYRKGQTSESISPVNAALAIELAKPYLKEGAQVLDPFCGVGTMLVERARAGKTGMLFGVDTFAEAIRIGRENCSAAGVEVYFINRDFLTFTHEYPFDEVISDLPRQCRDEETQEMIPPAALYHEFIRKLPELLREEAVLVLYTPLGSLLEEALGTDSRFRIAEKHTINEKNGTNVWVVRYRNE